MSKNLHARLARVSRALGLGQGAFGGATFVDLSLAGLISDVPAGQRQKLSPAGWRLAEVVGKDMHITSISRARAYRRERGALGDDAWTVRFDAEAKEGLEALGVTEDATYAELVASALAQLAEVGLTPREMHLARRYLERNPYAMFPTAEPPGDDVVAGESAPIPERTP
jgi:hypothetical protein